MPVSEPTTYISDGICVAAYRRSSTAAFSPGRADWHWWTFFHHSAGGGGHTGRHAVLVLRLPLFALHMINQGLVQCGRDHNRVFWCLADKPVNIYETLYFSSIQHLHTNLLLKDLVKIMIAIPVIFTRDTPTVVALQSSSWRRQRAANAAHWQYTFSPAPPTPWTAPACPCCPDRWSEA